MGDNMVSKEVPISEKVLKDWSKDISGAIPRFLEKERDSGVKELHAVLGPLLDTADTIEISPSHRATACNLICAIIEKCQASDATYAREAVLDDFIWSRLFSIYLERSDDAKSKSVRQVLLVLTGTLLKSESPRSLELQQRAATVFIDVICQRKDRLKVKPALQGLAHFLQKDIVALPQMLDIYRKLLKSKSNHTVEESSAESLLAAFLAWIVHHETSLSAGHLIKNFLTRVRSVRSKASKEEMGMSIWLQPVVHCLLRWPDCMQEVKTHVFPHCFLPALEEYLQFLRFLNFARHVKSEGPLPVQLELIDGRANGLDDYEEFRILLAAVEKGKELGIVKDVDYRLCKTIEVRDNALHLPDNIFEGWLSHIEPEVRLAGMYLSIHSTAVTKPITGGVLRSLKLNLVHLHTDTDANFRRELVSYLQKLFDRLRASTATLAKTRTKVSTSQTRLPIPQNCFYDSDTAREGCAHNPLIEAFRFIVWYIYFLEGELRLDASYQRRISALRAVTVVLKSGLDPRVPYHHLSKGAQGQLQWVHQLQIPNSRLVRSLFDLVLDPYDDIRDASVSVLQLCLESMPDEQRIMTLAYIPHFIARAETTMLRTGRADHADGVARAYALYFSTCVLKSVGTETLRRQETTLRIVVLDHLNHQLKDTLEVASQNLSEAVDGRPVHGTYAAIRYIVDNERFYDDLITLDADQFIPWKRIHDELLESFETLWSCVQDTLCADAPEGHVPENMEEEMSLDTKEILSYSWRGLKEASVLLRAIAVRAPIGSHDRALITSEKFEKLGRRCFTQLIELRHRGAFSTVAQTFAAFCRRCVYAEDEALRTLPDRWYQETLSSIQAKAHAITRRSGGIPALMSAIIAAEPQPGGKLFSRAMQDLVAEASVDAQSSNIEESRLPQVHALNCIKEVFMTSRLSLPSEAYIGEGLELAAKTLNSKIWPIRNCSLMLFKALIERLLGSDGAQDWKEQERAKTSRFSYDNYPSLVGILQGLLDSEGPLKESLDRPESNSLMDLHGAEGVFPALQILRQALPPEEHRAAIVVSVQKLLGSPHWHLRDMAARTATTLLRQSELPGTIKSLLACTDESVNSQHGALLHAKYALKTMLHDTTTLESHAFETVMHYFCGWATNMYLTKKCPFTKAAFLDLVNFYGIAIIKTPVCRSTIDAWSKLTMTLSVGPEHDISLSDAIGDALLQSSLAQVFFIDRSILRPECPDLLGSVNYQSVGGALLVLEAHDPDTCSAALDTLHKITQLKQPQGPLMQISLVILQVFHFVHQGHDPELLSKAQSVLADGLSLSSMPRAVLSLIKEDNLLATLDKLEQQCLEGAPSNAQSALRLLGFFLDWICHNHPSHRRTVLEKIARYIIFLRVAMIDTNPFDARFAAVQSATALSHIWTLSPTSKAERQLLLALVFVLYDMLNDDDDEIRDTAALTTTTLLQAHRTQCKTIKPVVPILTSHRLARFLVTHFTTSPELCKEALRRLTGTPPRTPFFNSPFIEAFGEARKEDTALFSTEKQNLFKDDTLDAILWSHVLCSLPPAIIPTALRKGLKTWVVDALSVLTATALEESDGALGWSAKPEVFTLGMRVICAAGVMLKWEGGSTDGMEVRCKLVEFVDVGKESEVHGLWLKKTEKVLEHSIVDALKGVKATLEAVQTILGV